MNDIIAKMVEEDPESEDGKRKVQKLVDRDVKKLRNDVERQVDQCKQDCPSECDSCGSAKIEELKLKLQVYLQEKHFCFVSKCNFSRKITEPLRLIKMIFEKMYCINGCNLAISLVP